MSFIRLAVAGFALCATATIASAQGGPPPGAPSPGGAGAPQGGRGGRGMAMLFDGITMTDAQQAKADSLQALYRVERQKLRPAGADAGPPDEAARTRMNELMDKQTKAIRAILTADQQKVYDANIEKRKQMMHQRGQ